MIIIDRGLRAVYESDYYGWVVTQVQLLRSKQFDAVDWENLIEEVESLGQSKRDALTEQIVAFYVNTLLAESTYPNRRYTVASKNAQIEIDSLLEDNPSLHEYLGDSVRKGYAKARKLAAVYADKPISAFPAQPIKPLRLRL